MATRLITDAFGKTYADNGPYVNTNVARPNQPNSAVNRPVPVRAPVRTDYGTPSREGLDTTQADMSRFLTDYTNPRGTSRFSDLIGSASSALARGRAEDVRQAQEISSRRGYVGGYSGEADRASRAYEQNRARIGFDAATSIAKDSAGLYDSAAGRYASLISAYNDQVGAGDRAYGGALQDARARQAAAVETFRQQQEAQREYDATLAENSRQFDTGLGEKGREFDVTSGEDKRQFDTSTGENKRQFDTTSALERDKLKAATRSDDLDRALALAKELGLDPRLLLGRLGMTGLGGSSVPGIIGRPGAVTSGGTRISSTAAY